MKPVRLLPDAFALLKNLLENLKKESTIGRLRYYVPVLKGNQEHQGQGVTADLPSQKKGGERMTVSEILELLTLIAVVTFGIISAMQKK